MVGVVLRIGCDDHITAFQAQPVGCGVQTLGAVLGEDVAIGIVGSEERCQGLPGLVHGYGHLGRHGVHAATSACGVVLVIIVHGPDDAVGTQGLTGAVHVDAQPLPDGGEVLPDRFDVHVPPIPIGCL